MNISIFYEKKDKYKTIRDLTYHIGNVGADLKTTKENIQDIDIAKYSYDVAKVIRNEMVINNDGKRTRSDPKQRRRNTTKQWNTNKKSKLQTRTSIFLVLTIFSK